MNTSLGCINWQRGPATFAINGTTITITVSYTSSPICQGALSNPIFNVNLGHVPSGTYTVISEAYTSGVLQNSVGSSLTVFPCLTTSISEIDIDANITLFPNPATDNLSLRINNLSGVYDYTIFDISGRIISGGIIQKELSTMNTNEFESGIYLIQLRNGEQTITKRFVVTR